MKKCPVCESLCFDDMAVCFGCMHRFDEDDAPEAAARGGQDKALREMPATEKAGSDKGARGEALPQVFEDVPAAPDEPPARVEPSLAEAGKHAAPARQTPLPTERPKANAPYESGRGSLRRRGSATTQVEAPPAGATQSIVLPGGQARYQLVVSLQPVAQGL